MSHKIAHLQMIQGVVNRLASNSFAIKGWSLTLVAAVLAVAKTAGADLLLVGVLPTLFFWALDGYFLSQERAFRGMHNKVRTKDETEIDFDMAPSGDASTAASFLSAVFSVTLILFYAGLLVATFLFAIALGLPVATSP